MATSRLLRGSATGLRRIGSLSIVCQSQPIGFALKECSMKTVVAIIRHERLHSLKRALKSVHAELLTVRGRGAHPDARVLSSPRIRVEILVKDTDAQEVVDLVREAAFSNGVISSNDGRIFVISVDPSRDHSERQHEALPAKFR